jgi:polysaccharide export outer membrane protein
MPESSPGIQKIMSAKQFVVLLIVITCFSTSCISLKEQTRSALYFRSVNDSLLNASASTDFEPVFQKGDILSITVATPNESSARLFNALPAASGSGTATSEPSVAPSGYLVDEKGNITLPLVGAVSAAGITRAGLTEDVTRRLKQYIENPVVSVRVLNYRITVLGEVAKPGTYSIPSERVSILDAIGLAGDLTIYGKRKNIRIIRTADGARQTATLDINRGDIFNSPFFYLRQNDVVYVEMNERKIPNTDQASLRNLSIGLGIVSALGVIISTINVLR